MEGKTDEIPPGVLTDHEMWLAIDAPDDALIEAGLCEEIEDVDPVRRGLIEEARWRLAERDAGRSFNLERRRASGLAGQLSERTLQRRVKRHHDEVRAILTRRRAGPAMSAASAAAKVRAEWDFETGRYSKSCEVCGKAFAPKRSDARTCGPKCRKRLSTGASDRRRWQGEDFRVLPPPKRH